MLRSKSSQLVVAVVAAVCSVVAMDAVPGQLADYLLFPGFLIGVQIFPEDVHGGTKIWAAIQFFNVLIYSIAIYGVIRLRQYWVARTQ